MKKVIFSLVALLAFDNLFADYNIYRCTGCHGAKFELKALNASNKKVSEMDEIEVAEILKAYKRGDYGGSMKIMMRAQVARYTDAELESMARDIKKLQE